MKSLRTKLVVVFSTTAAIGMMVVVLLGWFISVQAVRSEAVLRAEQISDQSAYEIAILSAETNGDIATIQRLFEKTALFEDIRTIALVAPDGTVLAHNDETQIGHSVHSPLIEQILQLKTDQSYIAGDSLMYAHAVYDQVNPQEQGNIVGIVLMDIDLGPSLLRSRQAFLLLLLIANGTMALATFLYYYITNSIVIARIRAVTSGLTQARNGTLDTRIEIPVSLGSADEINSLATQFNQMIATLQRRMQIEALTAQLSSAFISSTSPNIASTIDNTLQQVGKLFDADRCYIFEFTNQQTLMKNTFEWCAPGIEPQIENLQEVPSSLVPWWLEALTAGEVINIPSVENLPPEAANEKEILTAQGIQSVLVVPIILADTGLFGFLGLDRVQKACEWEAEDIHPLSTVTGIIGNAIALHHSQTELKNQRDFALLVMETMGQGLTITTSSGVFEYVNPAYARMVKRTPQELVGVSPTDLTHPDDLAQLQQAHRERQRGLASTYETRLIAADGEVVKALISSVPRFQDEKVSGTIAVITNLTDILRAEEKLRQSEARNRAFLDAIPDLIFRLDDSGQVIDFKSNNTDQFLHGIADPQIGKNISSFLPAKVAEKVIDNIETVLQTGKPQSFEYQIKTASGHHTFEARMVVSGAGEVLAVVHDISERVRLEQMKTDFINRASHELRTPLTTSLLMVELLDEKAPKEDEAGQFWEILRHELDRQRNLVEDLLTVGRIDSGSGKIQPVPTLICPILLDVARAIRPQAATRNIGIETEFPAELPNVYGSEEPLVRVFMNLLSNATKFSHPNSTVIISAHVAEQGVLVQVRDQGIGIPAEDLPHLTSRFFRASNATENEIPGSGIGLYIVKSIIEELGGRFTIESRLNVGTTMSVWLPIVP